MQVTNKVDHIEHFEDLLFSRGFEFMYVYTNDLYYETEEAKFSIKYDGAPSIIFGTDYDGRFFVASKSIFNKTPKINYSLEDIERNHSNSQGKIDILKKCFIALEKGSMLSIGVCYQADLMFTAGDLYSKETDDIYSQTWTKYCKPNVIEYQVPPEAALCDLGIAVHTVYSWDRQDLLTRISDGFDDQDYDIWFSVVRNIPGVYVFETRMTDMLYVNPAGTVRFEKQSIEAEVFLETYGVELKKYVNHCIRKNLNITATGFVIFLSEMDIENTSAQYVVDLLKSFKDIETILELHAQLTRYKRSLLFQNFNVHDNYVSGVLPAPGQEHEGMVVDCSGVQCKLVDRRKFSYENFKKHDSRKEA